MSSGGQLAWLSIAKPDTLRKEGVDLMVAGKLAAQCMTYMKKGEMINNTKNSRRPFEKGRALPYMALVGVVLSVNTSNIQHSA